MKTFQKKLRHLILSLSLSLSAILIFSFLISPTYATCTDSDGGNDIYVYGNATGTNCDGSNGVIGDQCFANDISHPVSSCTPCNIQNVAGCYQRCAIEEAVCFSLSGCTNYNPIIGRYSPGGSGVDCTYGCKNGACLRYSPTTTTTQQPNATTTTTRPPNTTTTTTAPNATTTSTLPNATTTTQQPNATTTTTLQPNTTTTTLAPNASTTTAQATTTTALPPCSSDVKTCADTDNGNNIYQAGTIKGSDGKTYSDFCAGNSTINEYYCAADGSVSSTTVNCGYDCKNGACKTYLENLLEQIIEFLKKIFGGK